MQTVTISRYWHNPQIKTYLTKDGIFIDTELSDFIKALRIEIGSVALTFTDKQFDDQLNCAFERVIKGIKEESIKVHDSTVPRKVIYVDIDETICKKVDDGDYSKAAPIKENISKINGYYDNNYLIVYWTARGTETKIDWRKVTERQLNEWGAKYHRLEFGKPAYDLFICDKATTIQQLGGI